MGSLAVKRGLRKRANTMLWGSVGVGILSYAPILLAEQLGFVSLVLAGLLSVVAAVMWFAGFVAWAKAKGQSPWLGSVGVLGLFGVVVMLIVPDKFVVSYDGFKPGSMPTGGPEPEDALAQSPPVPATAATPPVYATGGNSPSSIRRKYIW